jgi:riboflavin-specific deaminase-like protein
LHRLRALSDAVLIGANTALADDPKLTTRLVPGDNPTRVVIDPSLRLPPTLQVFADGRAPTLVLGKRGSKRPAGLPEAVELVELPGVEAGRLDPAQIVAELKRRGLRRILVEGGGITVSAFLRAGALSRMHVAVGSLIIGAGRPGLLMPAIESLEQALRPKARRFFMGDDVLFDCDLAPRA